MLEVLAGYPDDYPEPERVRVDMVLLAEGDLGRLHELVVMAKRDPRDIMAWAEYPKQMQLGAPSPSDDPAQREAQQVAREADAETFAGRLAGTDGADDST